MSKSVQSEVGQLLGFSPLPLKFFLVLAGLIVIYMALVDLAKIPFYRVHRTASDGQPAASHRCPAVSATAPPPGSSVYDSPANRPGPVAFPTTITCDNRGLTALRR